MAAHDDTKNKDQDNKKDGVVKSKLECPVCLSSFGHDKADTLPRLLSCGHSMCTGCLTSMVKQHTRTVMWHLLPIVPPVTSRDLCFARCCVAKLSCPECRQVTQHQGIHSLPVNFALKTLMEHIANDPANALSTDSPVTCQSCDKGSEVSFPRVCSRGCSFSSVVG